MSPRDTEAKEQEKAAQQAGDEAAQAIKDETGIGDKPPSDPTALRAEIEQTREELGETVDALARKTDVKAQAQARVEEGKEALQAGREQAQAKVAEAGRQAGERPVPVAALAAGALLAVIAIVLLRRR